MMDAFQVPFAMMSNASERISAAPPTSRSRVMMKFPSEGVAVVENIRPNRPKPFLPHFGRYGRLFPYVSNLTVAWPNYLYPMQTTTRGWKLASVTSGIEGTGRDSPWQTTGPTTRSLERLRANPLARRACQGGFSRPRCDALLARHSPQKPPESPRTAE